jgi:hypothetical protein
MTRAGKAARPPANVDKAGGKTFKIQFFLQVVDAATELTADAKNRGAGKPRFSNRLPDGRLFI